MHGGPLEVTWTLLAQDTITWPRLEFIFWRLSSIRSSWYAGPQPTSPTSVDFIQRSVKANMCARRTRHVVHPTHVDHIPRTPTNRTPASRRRLQQTCQTCGIPPPFPAQRGGHEHHSRYQRASYASWISLGHGGMRCVDAVAARRGRTYIPPLNGSPSTRHAMPYA